jgi:hypothetical protein
VLSVPRWEVFARSCLDDLIPAAAGSPMVLLRLLDLRVAEGVSMVERQARLPVPPLPHQRVQT